MKAVIYTKYGCPEVLRLTEIEKPVPLDNELLIKIHATDVTAADCRMRKADPWLVRLLNGLFKPKRFNILGGNVAGIVEATGSNVTKFKTGDLVFASCGLKFGGYAEYITLPENSFVSTIPENMTLQEAATVPSNSVTALRFLRNAGIGNGKNVLIYGASGSVGTFAIQIATSFGAEVTGVCSAKNIELVHSLGAKVVLDYNNQDFSHYYNQFDIVFDAVGKANKSLCKHLLAPGGRFVTVNDIRNKGNAELWEIKDLIEKGKLKTVIDKEFTLNQIVEAHQYVDTARKRGNVIVKVVETDLS